MSSTETKLKKLSHEMQKEVEHFLKKADTADLYISGFTIYSMGIILFRLNKHTLFSQWIDDLRRAGVQFFRLVPIDLMTLMESTTDFNLDFDDDINIKLLRIMTF